jgi:hypothetical protein
MCAFSVFCDSIALHQYVFSFIQESSGCPAMSCAYSMVDECVLVDVMPPDQVLRVNFIEFAMLHTTDAAEPSMARNIRPPKSAPNECIS